MKRQTYYILCSLTIPLLVADCRQAYVPPVVKANKNFLVVEGYINIGQDTTRIKLSRTANITDTLPGIPANGAIVKVEGESGDSYNLNEDSNGIYSVPGITGSSAQKYRITINTADGRKYASDFVESKQTPPIDSISWEALPDGVHIYANAHDDANATKYYKWDYVETWEYHAAYDSYWDYINGSVVARPGDKHIYKCWRTITSSNISLASTTKLSADVVYKQQVMFIPISTQRIGIKYSILLKQHALTQAGFNYWQQLSKNTEQLGSLFDAQPSQLPGNIHNIADDGETVVGFITASTQQQKRIFISKDDVGYWHYPPDHNGCDTVHLSTHEKELLYLSQGYIIVDSYTFGKSYATTVYCADCRMQGGVLTKPSFWP